MKSSERDMAVMLDELGLHAAALRWKELSGSPEYPDFTPEQLLPFVFCKTRIVNAICTMNRSRQNGSQSRYIFSP